MEDINIDNLSYISVDNLELLYKNVKGFFKDVHNIDINNYNTNIKKILFENMKLIYSTKHAPSLKTTQLNLITLKNIKEILLDEINKLNKNTSKNKTNIDIISRENNIYNRENRIVDNLNESYTNNIDLNKNFSKDYDNLLSDRNNSIEKIDKPNFGTEFIQSDSLESINKNMENLLQEREQILLPPKDDKDKSEENKLQEHSNNNNENNFLNLEGFNEDDNIGSLIDSTNDVNINNLNKDVNESNNNVEKQNEQNNNIENQIILRKQVIVLSSSKRDMEKYPNPYNYTIELKYPIRNIINIKLLNVLINISKVKSNINYLLLNINDLKVLTSNNENINNKFAIVYGGKIYNEEINFIEPLEILDKFDIKITDKNDKIVNNKDNDNKNDNIIELLIEYF